MELSEQQQLILDLVRRLAQERVAPRAAEIDERDEFPRDLWELFREAGLLRLVIPEEYGGLGADHTTICLVVEELAKASASAAHIVFTCASNVSPLLIGGSAELKARILPRYAAEGWLAALAITEPEAGSDVAALQSTARRVGDHYILNGSKAMISNGDNAGLYCLFAKTDPAAGRKGISAFAIEAGTPGLVAGRHERKMGMRGSVLTGLTLEEVRVPVANRLGAEGDGFRICMESLNSARLITAAHSLGIAGGALEYARQYARQRRQFGQAIAEFQGVQALLADMATQLEAARSLTYEATRKYDAKAPDFVKFSAMAKLFATDMVMQVTTDAVQVLGGYGYLTDHPVERMMRDAKVEQIWDGTNQIQRMVIGRILAKEA
jgi:alkylation response protein AidB-like acyl-CoA dehydrogenase